MIIGGNTHVLGNKLNALTDPTVYARLKSIFTFHDNPPLLYPLNSAAIAVPCTAVNWGWGAFTTIVASSVITSDYRIVGVCRDKQGNNQDNWDIEVAYGVGDTVVWQCTFSGKDIDDDFSKYMINCCPVIPANSEITARAANEDSGGVTNIYLKVWVQLVV